MLRNCIFRTALAGGLLLGFGGELLAELRYEPVTTSDNFRFVVVKGRFDYDDDLSEFSAVVRRHSPSVVTFDSPGGNPFKAMELGRKIRALRLGTVQLRKLECTSACALAFLGGETRFADPGSIGVHRSSFSGNYQLSRDEAVSVVQVITAEVMTYISEMGADPSLLQLSLRYDASDVRYLSGSEMEQYRVVTGGEASQPAPAPPSGPPAAIAPARVPPPASSPPLIPEPRTGRIRHHKGRVALKTSAQVKSPNLAILDNGTPVRILSSNKRWYRVSSAGRIGYLHHTWVFVDQYVSGPFGHRHIQVKSFDNLADAVAYARSSPLLFSAYLATNGWFAITLQNTYDEATARSFVERLKARAAIPEDSFITYGNTYVRKVCCR